jgi:anti-sigma factor RsiW
VDNLISSRPAAVSELAELEAENARLHKAAAELTVYLLTLQAALSGRAAKHRPRLPA